MSAPCPYAGGRRLAKDAEVHWAERRGVSRAVEALRGCVLICCEDTRHSAKLLSHAGIEGVRRAVSNEHTEAARVQQVLALLADGRDVSVITDAGMPGISDPGMVLVRAAIEAGHAVTVVPGPDAVTTALVLSGLDTSRFVFEGLDRKSTRLNSSHRT